MSVCVGGGGGAGSIDGTIVCIEGMTGSALEFSVQVLCRDLGLAILLFIDLFKSFI